MKRYCELYGSQAGPQMAGIAGTTLCNKLPQFCAQLRQLINIKFFKIFGTVYSFQQIIHDTVLIPDNGLFPVRTQR